MHTHTHTHTAQKEIAHECVCVCISPCTRQHTKTYDHQTHTPEQNVPTKKKMHTPAPVCASHGGSGGGVSMHAPAQQIHSPAQHSYTHQRHVRTSSKTKQNNSTSTNKIRSPAPHSHQNKQKKKVRTTHTRTNAHSITSIHAPGGGVRVYVCAACAHQYLSLIHI